MLQAGYILDGKYEVVRTLGKGGMGMVYLCRNTRLGNFWAIKEITKSISKHTSFLAEPNILKNLSHPGIPRIVDIFYENDNLYMVEDYIEGQTLEDMVKHKGGCLEVEEICRISLKLCHILQYLHGFNPPIIYRDLKPSNIMITSSGEVVIVDFGISRVYKEGQEGDTVFMGSMGYAAPEQYGKSQSNEQTDIYGLGAVMYYMACGKEPSLLLGILKEDLGSNINRGLKDIIQKSTEIEPQNRYLSVKDLSNDISLLLDKHTRVLHDNKSEIPKSDSKTMVMSMKKPSNERVVSTNKHRSKRIVWKLAASVLLLAAFLLAAQYFIWNNKKVSLNTANTNTKSSNEEVSSNKTPAVQEKPVEKPAETSKPKPIEDINIQGSINLRAPVTVDNDDSGNRGKGKGKIKKDDDESVFYKVSPIATAGRYDNKFIVKLELVERTENDTAVYGTIENNTDKEFNIVFYNNIYGDKSKPSGTISISPNTKKNIKVVFEDYKLNSEEIAVKAKVVSKDSSYNRDLNMSINVSR